MAFKKAAKEDTVGTPVKIVVKDNEITDVYVMGTSDMMMNRMAFKALGQLAIPGWDGSGKKEGRLKHDFYAEFWGAAHILRDPKAPTFLYLPGGAFKKSIVNGTRDIPGLAMTEVGRHVTVIGNDIPMWGIPVMDIRIERQSDMARTPDPRCRPLFTEWACKLTVSYPVPQYNQTSIANLVKQAGQSAGIGEHRPEKKGDLGKFRIVNKPEFDAFIKGKGRKEQEAAMKKPGYANADTEDLYTWFNDTIKKIGKEDLLTKVA